MTVYVDDFRVEARVAGMHSRWSHLIADTPEELHAFAERLNLRRVWFQDPTVNGKPKAEPGTRGAENWHYDVTDSKRKEAIRLGAVPVPWRQLPEVIEARWQIKVRAAADYWMHKESCWYAGNPAEPGGRGCSEHNRLYDGWQAALRGELGAAAL